MGRKKRKIDSTNDLENELATNESTDRLENDEAIDINAAPPQQETENEDNAEVVASAELVAENVSKTADDVKNTVVSSSYAMTSHSGELIQEDVYVSDGSLDSDDEVEMEIVLTSSRMGIMRRGLHHQMIALQQPNRQWKRQDAATANLPATTLATTEGEESAALSPEEAEELKRKREEEELSQLDPAQRAARLLIDKQRREAEAKIEERRHENEENVMRDATLFSKRTAFDIRFDQIDDKPWERGIGTSDNKSEYFNYGLSEVDWLEYAAQQLVIRQELIDAYRQKRLPDPAIVPIQLPTKKEEPSSVPEVNVTAIAPKTEEVIVGTVSSSDVDMKDAETATEISRESNEIASDPSNADETIVPNEPIIPEIPIGVGGAWGAGAAPGSFLARLIEEQEKVDSPDATSPVKHEPPESHSEPTKHQDVDDTDSYRGSNDYTKSERDYKRYKRHNSGGEADDQSIRDGDESSQFDGNDDDQSGRHWNRPGPPPAHQGWHQAPPPPPPHQSHHRMDNYNSYPPAPPHGTGYQGRGSGRGGGAPGGRGGRSFPPRGGGRGGGGRGYYNNRDSTSSGRGGDFYQEQQHSGWKRPRSDDDQRRRH